jgi:phosphoribosylformylglycinamidine synthase
MTDVGDLHLGDPTARTADTLARPDRPREAADQSGDLMGRVVVDVMPKPEILDPQGKAVAGALARLGFAEFTGARQGKRFELEVEGEVTEAVIERAREAAVTLLSNPVIEDVVRVAALEAVPQGPPAR